MSTKLDKPSSRLNRRPPNDSKPPCRFWLKGSCSYGEGCKYTHGEKPTAAGPNNDSMIGRKLKAGEGLNTNSKIEVNTGNTSPNESTDAKDDSNPALDQKAKESNPDSAIPKAPVKRACRDWLKAGTCRFGGHCNFRQSSAK